MDSRSLVPASPSFQLPVANLRSVFQTHDVERKLAKLPGKDYENLVGQQLGWSRVPAGKRASTYSNPSYLQQASAFAKPTEDAINSADPANPGVQPRPAIGIQFVDIPEFPDIGTQISQDVSSAIAGKTSVEDALNKSQPMAEDVGKKYAGQ